eukprot:Skav204297  [mRNA]  locus=scaffold2227:29053:29672:- [translate_table: standard]
MVCHRDPSEQQQIYQKMQQEFPNAKQEEAWAILLRLGRKNPATVSSAFNVFLVRGAVLNEDRCALEWLTKELEQNGYSLDSHFEAPALRRAVKMLRDWQQAEQLRQPREEAALPHGWQSTRDPNTGLPYYWRTEDPAGTVTWDRPS